MLEGAPPFVRPIILASRPFGRRTVLSDGQRRGPVVLHFELHRRTDVRVVELEAVPARLDQAECILDLDLCCHQAVGFLNNHRSLARTVGTRVDPHSVRIGCRRRRRFREVGERLSIIAAAILARDVPIAGNTVSVSIASSKPHPAIRGTVDVVGAAAASAHAEIIERNLSIPIAPTFELAIKEQKWKHSSSVQDLA